MAETTRKEDGVRTPSALRGRLVFAGKLLLAVALILLIVDKIGVRDLWDTARRGDPITLCLGVLLTIPFVLCKMVRWQYLLRRNNIAVPFSKTAQGFLAGQAMGVLTPARVGELSRSAFLPQGSRGTGMWLVIADRGFDLMGVAAFAAWGAAAFFGPMGLLAISALFLGGLLLLSPRPLIRMSRKLKLSFMEKLSRCGESITWPTPVLATAASLTAIAYLLGYLTIYCYVSAFQPIGLADAMRLIPLVTVCNLIPLTPGGFGIREAAALYLFTEAGYDPASAVLAYSLMYCFSVAGPGVVGLAWTGFLKKRDAHA